MIKINFPSNFTSENKEWIKNTIKGSIESISSTIEIYFKIKIKECKIELEIIEKLRELIK